MKGMVVLKRKIRGIFAVLCMVFLLANTVSLASGDSNAAEKLYDPPASARVENSDRNSVTKELITDADNIVPGKLVVKFADHPTVRSKTFLNMNSSMIKSLEKTADSNIVTVDLAEDTDIHKAAVLFSKQPGVEFAEPLYIYKAYGLETAQPRTVTEAVYEPDDPYYRNKWQWGLQAINVTDIWNRVPEEIRSKVTIAVIDTGVDLDHPDLKDSLVDGYDFANNDNDPDDDNGHGTHVAGIAAAIANNGTGIAGVASGAKIMPVKVLNKNGRGSTLDIYLGIVYAVKNGADVINLSLGSSVPSQLVKEAIEYAVSHDVVVVAATGNEYSSSVGFPAAFDGVLGVGAVDYMDGNDFILAAFSNFGPETDLTAPGVDIISTIPVELDIFDGKQDGYTLYEGTSMATPFVAGMAALLRAENPELSCHEIGQKLMENAYDIYYDGWDAFTGAGVVNGSAGEAKVPDIFEFPNVSININRLSSDSLNIEVTAGKAKGVPSDSFNGDITVNFSRLLSEPFNDYYYYGRILSSAGSKLQADYDFAADTEISVTVSVYSGFGETDFTFEKSGFYLFSPDSQTIPENFVLTYPNAIFKIENNDVCISGNINIEKPFDKDTCIMLLAVNEIYSLYIDSGYAEPVFLIIPAGTETYPYELYLPRDTKYKLYYGILDDNDIYYNYGFYREPSVTSRDPLDFTPIDLTGGSAAGIDLNINIVEDLDDDVSDTRENALELSLEEPDGLYFDIFSLEYKGDRDFFRIETEETGTYLFAALPYSYQNLRITVYNLSGEVIASDLNSEISLVLTPGTYYVKVEDETGLETGIYILVYGIWETDEHEPVTVEFEDENLEAAIRTLLGKSVSEAVYDYDVAAIENLDISNMNISSIKGLEYFKSLWCLELGNNNISELGPLQDLMSLELLDITGNNITDLSPISALPMLCELDASNNKISALPGNLYGWGELYHLDLSGNEITDITPLSALPNIEALFLHNNRITSIEPLRGMDQLRVLYLKNNPITDYSPVKPYYLNLGDVDFYFPVATDVSISGNDRVGSTLTGSYTYSNANGHPESGTTFRWLRSSEADGEYTAIEGADSIKYTLTKADIGKYIKFEVTPGADGAPSTGFPATSAAFGPIKAAASDGDSGSGSGHGSGTGPGTDPGTGTTTEPVPTKVPEQSPGKEIVTDENGNSILIANAMDLQPDWNTAPVIDAASDSDVSAAEARISADLLSESLRQKQPVIIKFNGIVFTIQPGTIEIPEKAESIMLRVNYMNENELPAELKAPDAKGVSGIFDISLTIDGKPVSSFEKPISVTMQIDMAKAGNTDKIGVYNYNSRDNKWTFLGGKVDSSGTISFTTPHFSLFRAMESTKTFSDIQQHWAKEDIEIMAARHVTEGTGDNKFTPDANITRAEFTAMIVRALNITEKTEKNPFIDVKSGDWFEDAALRANAAGIIQGDNKGNFSPGNLITREEIAAVAVRAYSYYSGENPDRIITTREIRFTDMDDASEWASKSVTLASALGLMKGFPDKSFRPKNYCSRAEAIVVVKRLMKLLEIF